MNALTAIDVRFLRRKLALGASCNRAEGCGVPRYPGLKPPIFR
jgi:hypothetical protein